MYKGGCHGVGPLALGGTGQSPLLPCTPAPGPALKLCLRKLPSVCFICR
uniref:Uncharacterized protein n=1 Tax=Arundo donax TaxID=35708 RepID=A0A0A8XS39_ARUDO